MDVIRIRVKLRNIDIYKADLRMGVKKKGRNEISPDNTNGGGYNKYPTSLGNR